MAETKHCDEHGLTLAVCELCMDDTYESEINRLEANLKRAMKVVEAAKEYCNSVEFDGQPCHEEYGYLRKALRELEGEL